MPPVSGSGAVSPMGIRDIPLSTSLCQQLCPLQDTGLRRGVDRDETSGGATSEVVVLLTPEDVDDAAKMSVDHRRPDRDLVGERRALTGPSEIGQGRRRSGGADFRCRSIMASSGRRQGGGKTARTRVRRRQARRPTCWAVSPKSATSLLFVRCSYQHHGRCAALRGSSFGARDLTGQGRGPPLRAFCGGRNPRRIAPVTDHGNPAQRKLSVACRRRGVSVWPTSVCADLLCVTAETAGDSWGVVEVKGVYCRRREEAVVGRRRAVGRG
jgi:hypothetical protein